MNIRTVFLAMREEAIGSSLVFIAVALCLSMHWALATFSLHMQIPNFLLAMPILYLSFTGCYEYFSQDWTRTVQLGLLSACPSSTHDSKLQSQEKMANSHPCLTPTKASGAKAPKAFDSIALAPYIHQWAVMTACAVFVMNVQVATR